MVFRDDEARRQIAEKNRNLKNLRRRLEERERELAGLRVALAGRSDEAGGVRAEDFVWIFGAGRTGSTWLSAMMEEIEDHSVWFEPGVGDLFGHLYYARSVKGQHMSKHFILGSDRETWLRSVRAFVLGEAGARFPEVAAGAGKLIVKEPHGSIGAPLLMEALPESRMILLVRDPRDVAASYLDAYRKGGWGRERHGSGKAFGLADESPEKFLAARARTYSRHVGKAREAYEAFGGKKILVRYEDLRTDTLEVVKEIHSALGLPVGEEELVQAVEKHSWENIPEEKRGRGKFYRKASPGAWSEDLTEEQISVVEEETGKAVEDLYFDA